MNPNRKIAWEKFTPNYDSTNFQQIEELEDEDEDLEEDNENIGHLVSLSC